jgi:hypothetical protein
MQSSFCFVFGHTAQVNACSKNLLLDQSILRRIGANQRNDANDSGDQQDCGNAAQRDDQNFLFLLFFSSCLATLRRIGTVRRRGAGAGLRYFTVSVDMESLSGISNFVFGSTKIQASLVKIILIDSKPLLSISGKTAQNGIIIRNHYSTFREKSNYDS